MAPPLAPRKKSVDGKAKQRLHDVKRRAAKGYKTYASAQRALKRKENDRKAVKAALSAATAIGLSAEAVNKLNNDAETLNATIVQLEVRVDRAREYWQEQMNNGGRSAMHSTAAAAAVVAAKAVARAGGSKKRSRAVAGESTSGKRSRRGDADGGMASASSSSTSGHGAAEPDALPGLPIAVLPQYASLPASGSLASSLTSGGTTTNAGDTNADGEVNHALVDAVCCGGDASDDETHDSLTLISGRTSKKKQPFEGSERHPQQWCTVHAREIESLLLPADRDHGDLKGKIVGRGFAEGAYIGEVLDTNGLSQKKYTVQGPNGLNVKQHVNGCTVQWHDGNRQWLPESAVKRSLVSMEKLKAHRALYCHLPTLKALVARAANWNGVYELDANEW